MVTAIPTRIPSGVDMDIFYADNHSARLRRRGRQVFAHDFREGLGAFRSQHTAYATWKPPVSRSMILSEGAMMLSTDESAYKAAGVANTVGSYAGLSRSWSESGKTSLVVSSSCEFAYAQTGATSPDTQNSYAFAFSEIVKALDTMNQAGTLRSFFQTRIKASADNATHATLQLRSNTTAGAGDGTSSWVDVPSSTLAFQGGNEGKLIRGYWRDSYDLLTGKYIETQMNGLIFNTEGLVTAAKDKLLDTGATNDFRAGFNLGYWLSRSTVNTTLSDNRLYIMNQLVTVGDVLA